MATSTSNPATATPDPLSMGAVLRIPTLRRLWYAQIVSVFGDFLALFAVIGVLTFCLQSSPQQVIGLQIAYLLPIAILGILAGVFVDRWPTKPTLVSSDAIRCGLCLLLLVATRLWHFYAILAAISVVSSFFGPAQGVAIRSAVPFHGLRSANALMQQVMFGMRIIGPSAAAFLVASFGAISCYILDAASFAASATLIASITLAATPPAAAPSSMEPATAATPHDAATETPTPNASETSQLRRIAADMQAGTSFILHHAALLFTIVALAAGMFIMGCFGPLIAVYVRDSLHASTRVFGIASALIGVGMFLGVNLLTTVGKRWPNTLLVYSGLGGIALGLVLLTLLPRIWSTMLGNLVIGIAVAGIIVPAQTLIQEETPAALLGRVGSTVMSAIFAAQIAGLILSGLLANHIGVRHVFGVCAALLAALILAGRLWMEPQPHTPGASA